jgi:hypothetical protein
MFSLLPPPVFGNSESRFPARPMPWILIIILVIASGWTPTQAALTLAVLSMITTLSLIVAWNFPSSYGSSTC